MSKTKKYGVRGLMEWKTAIPAGKAKFEFHFSGGMNTAYGEVPATYETKNKLYQMVIENSSYYKNGKIVLLSDGYEGETDEDEGNGHAPTSSGDGTPEVVSMPTVQDARQFLIDGYNAEASQLMNKAAIVSYAKAKGIVFDFGKGKN